MSFTDVLALQHSEYQQRIAYGDDPLQFGLLWRPVTPANPPLVIFIHGGCWLNSFDVDHSSAASAALAAAGYAVWSLEYRRTGDSGGGWPGSFEDIQQAIAARALLQEHEIDTSRFVIAGHSAGGHLALLAGSKNPQASAVIGLAAISDIEVYAAGDSSCNTATTAFMGATPTAAADLYSSANPARQNLHNNTILLHGDSDDIVPLSQSLQLDKTLVVAENAGHFDLIHPDTAAFARLLEILAEHLPL